MERLTNAELLKYLELLLSHNKQLLPDKNCGEAISNVIDELKKRI